MQRKGVIDDAEGKMECVRRSCVGAGAVRGGECGGYRHVDRRSVQRDRGYYHDRPGNPGSGCSYFRISDCAGHAGPLISGGLGRALLVGALALVLLLFGDVAGAGITKVLPSQFFVGDTGQVIVIEGSSFTSAGHVYWGSTLLTGGTLSGNSIWSVPVPDALLSAAGSAYIRISEPTYWTNGVGVVVSQPMWMQLAPVLYVSAGLLGAIAFIWGMGTKWS